MSKYETIVVRDSETDNNISIDLVMTDISDDRELEIFLDEIVRKIWHKQEKENETVTNCHHLKTKSSDGKIRSIFECTRFVAKKDIT